MNQIPAKPFTSLLRWPQVLLVLLLLRFRAAKTAKVIRVWVIYQQRKLPSPCKLQRVFDLPEEAD